MTPLTEFQHRLLCLLVDGGGGIPDRYGRVVICGNPSAHGSSVAWLALVARGYVAGLNGRLLPTPDGLEAARLP